MGRKDGRTLITGVDVTRCTVLQPGGTSTGPDHLLRSNDRRRPETRYRCRDQYNGWIAVYLRRRILRWLKTRLRPSNHPQFQTHPSKRLRRVLLQRRTNRTPIHLTKLGRLHRRNLLQLKTRQSRQEFQIQVVPCNQSTQIELQLYERRRKLFLPFMCQRW